MRFQFNLIMLGKQFTFKVDQCIYTEKSDKQGILVNNIIMKTTPGTDSAPNFHCKKFCN